MARNDQFRRNMRRILAEREAKAWNFMRACGMMLLNRVTERSPVGNPTLWKNPGMAPPGYVGGRFKSNWQVGVGTLDMSNNERPDASGAGALSRGYARIGAWNEAAHLYITNSMPYCRRLEYDHWSSQAPAGMTRITAREFRQIAQSLANQLR